MINKIDSYDRIYSREEKNKNKIIDEQIISYDNSNNNIFKFIVYLIYNKQGQNSNNFNEFIIAITVVTTYLVLSISLVFSNKLLLQQSDKNLSQFITWSQCTISSILTIFINIILKILGYNIPVLRIMTPYELGKKNFTYLCIISLLFNMLLIFNNSCQKYLDISLYQIARSQTIVCTILVSYIVLHKLPSSKQIFYCLLVVIGYILSFITEGVYETQINYLSYYYYKNLQYIYEKFGLYTIQSLYMYTNTSSSSTSSYTNILHVYNISIVYGQLYGLGSSFVQSIYTISIQLLSLKASSFTLNIYNNIIGSLVLAINILCTNEINTIIESDIIYSRQFIHYILITSFIGFLLGLIVIIQIKYTTALMHNIIGTTKAVLQVVLHCILYDRTPKINYIIGLILVLTGCSLYTNTYYKEKIK